MIGVEGGEGICYQWKEKGQCSQGDRCSFRHETQDRSQKPEHTAATPSEPSMSRSRSESKNRSFRGTRNHGSILGQPCRYCLRGTCTRTSCEYWHPPECQFYTTEAGCKAGEGVRSRIIRLTNKQGFAQVCLFLSACVRKTLAFAMSNGERIHYDFGSARRRRERRLRCFLRHEEMTVRMAVAAAVQHSAYNPNVATYVDAHTQTMTFSDAATYAATASPFTVTEDGTRTCRHLCCTSSNDRKCGTRNTETVNTYVAPALVMEYIAPSPAVSDPSFLLRSVSPMKPSPVW